MRGQWIGKFQGTHTGLAVLDLDEESTRFDGVGYIFPSDLKVPASVAVIQTADKSASGVIRAAPVMTMNPNTNEIVPNEQRATAFPEWILPDTAEIKFSRHSNKLKMSWITNIGTQGKASLARSPNDAKSKYKASATIKTWEEFKSFALNLEEDRYIFRGQPIPRKLVTSFHRTNRVNVLKFILDDIPRLHRALSARTRHVFDLSKGLENGAFYNLVQHHGYPTPLLDWSYSPFVASFFAFRYAGRNANNIPVRIFVFDKKLWSSHFNQLQKLAPTRPHFSIMDFTAIGNERLIPQQALSSITNVEDIEAYIQSREMERSETYLTVIDLPRGEWRKAMRELALMGITAGALFPGLDGACEALREKYFEE